MEKSDQKTLVNRVANSGLITINLEPYYPESPVYEFDLKPFLFKELILKEKDFRAELKEFDWSSLKGQHVVIFCSVDAIVPVWAYMLIAAYVKPFAESIFQGSKQEFIKIHYAQILKKLDLVEYKQQRIIIKGCSNKPVPPAAYVQLTELLQPIAQSIMYGEPCSTVPIFKRPRVIKKS